MSNYFGEYQDGDDYPGYDPDDGRDPDVPAGVEVPPHGLVPEVAEGPVPCDPSEAGWYVEVVYDLPRGGGECDYSYGYYRGDRPTRAFARQRLVPDGRVMLECKINKCGGS